MIAVWFLSRVLGADRVGRAVEDEVDVLDVERNRRIATESEQGPARVGMAVKVD